MDNTITQQKEQFGIAQFNRVSMYGPNGVPVLFGADVQTNNVICLTISKNAVMEDSNLMGRRYYPSRHMNDQVCQIYMSHAQFADLITNMNVGEGIPVTIAKVNGNSLPSIEKDDITNIIDAERNAIKEEFQNVIQEATASLKEMEEILSKPSIGKNDRKELINKYHRILMQLEDNMPFYIKKAGEAIEKLADKAKVELGAAAQTALIQAGCTALGMDTANSSKLLK